MGGRRPSGNDGPTPLIAYGAIALVARRVIRFLEENTSAQDLVQFSPLMRGTLRPFCRAVSFAVAEPLRLPPHTRWAAWRSFPIGAVRTNGRSSEASSTQFRYSSGVAAHPAKKEI
jgi:hypothetical protein